MNAGQRARLVRVTALVVGVLLLVLGLAPYGFGLRAHTMITTLAEQLAQVWHVPVVTTRYQRGWFSSTAEMRLMVSAVLGDVWRTSVPTTAVPQAAAGTVEVTHRVLHGPFPLTTATHSVRGFAPVQALLQSTFRLGSSGEAPVQPPPEIPPILHVTTTVFLSGASQSRVFLPAFVAPPGGTLAAPLVWNGLRGEVSVTRQGRHLLGAFRAPGLYLKRAQTQMSLHNVLLRLEASSEPRQPLHGQLSLSLDSLEVGPEAEAQAEWAIQDGELRTTMAIAGETMQADVEVQCALCRLANMASGQGTARFEARRFSLPALRGLGQEVAALWPDEPDVRTLWWRLVFSGELAHLLAALARTSPTLALTQARLHTPEGEVFLTAHIQLDGERVLASEHLPLLLQSLNAEATLEAPAAWVQAIAVAQAVRLIRAHSAFGSFLSLKSLRTMAAIAVDRYLRNMIEKAYIIQEGTRYKSRARYTKGQLMVNEKPVELPTLAPQ